MNARTLTRIVVTIGATILGVPTARAEDAQVIASARTFGIEGVELADQGRCQEAIPKLERAEKLHHAPSTAARLGECLVEIGMLVAGTERLQRVVREPLGPNAPAAFTAAVERARNVLDRALPRLAKLHIAVSAPADVRSLSVMLDGRPISMELLDAEVPIDPGDHHLRATARGCLAAASTIHLDEGKAGRVELKLEVDPNWRKPPPELPAEPVRPEPRPYRLPMFVAYGVGGVGVAVGVVTGILASSRTSDATDQCPDKRCVTGSEGERSLDSAETLGTASTVAFLVGGVGIATGTALFFLAPRKPSPAGARMSPVVGLGTVGLTGSF